MKRVFSIIAAILWSCAAHAQSLNIPGVQAAGTPAAPHIASWLNATTLTDTGVSITGLTVGVTSVQLTTGNASIFTVGNVTITSNGSLTFSFLPQNGVLASPAGGGVGNVSFRPLTGSDFGVAQTHAVLIGPFTGSAAIPTFRQLTGSDLPVPTLTTLGGVQAVLTTASNWIDSISTLGVPHKSQPSFADLSGSITCNQAPSLTGAVTTLTDSCVTSIPINSLTNGELALMSGGSVKGYVGAGTGQPNDLSPSAVLDALPGSPAAGNTLARASTGWTQVAPATSGYIWQSNGAGAIPSWVLGGFFNTISTAIFTSGSVYTPSAAIKYAVVFATGGGAGGGTGTGSANGGAGGGGAGGTAIGIYPAATLGSSVAFTVGSAGGASTNGGTTSFGSLLTANGGTAGANAGGTINGQIGGSGGTASGTSALAFGGGYGASGGIGNATDVKAGSGGNGGDSYWGGGGRGGVNDGVNPSGQTALAYGAGGGGATGATGGGAGSGFTGVIYVIEFR